MQELIKIYSYAAQFKADMFKAIALLTVSVVMAVIPYFFVYDIIVCFLSGENVDIGYLALMAGLIFICLVLKTYLHGKGLAVSHRLAYNTLLGMRSKVAEKLMKMPMGAIARHGTGSLKKNFVENIEDMEILLAHALPEGVSNLLTLVVLIAVLGFFDWRMALLALAVLPIGMAAVILMVKEGMTRMGPYYQASREMNENIIEYITGMEVIKVFNQTTTSLKKYSASVEGYKTCALNWYQVSWNYMTIYSIVLPSSLLFLLPAGTLLFLNGTLELGMFIFCILLAMSMGLPLMRLVEFLPVFPQLRQQAEKIEQLFAEEELDDNGRCQALPHYTVAFEGVTFAYKDKHVLQDVSFVALQNTVTALVGPSGAGKTTLAKLLVRFWEAQQGQIRIGGVDIKDISFAALMNTISYVSQDVFLFNTTIMDNIRMGRPDAGDEEVIAMARLAQCHEFIMQMPQQYATVVGDAGDRLSGGQRQRIAIARAMLKDAPIIVLDEATSFTDPENEDRIQEALNGLIQGKTLLVIAHRLSTIVDADQIIVLEDGKIAACGEHDELLATSQLYQTMWQTHIEAMDWDIASKERSA